FVLKAFITFVLTNIQDIVILINFFLEASRKDDESTTLETGHVVLGQYLGFSTLLTLSLIGYAISYAIPIKLLGFLGFLIIFIGLNGLRTMIKHRCCKKEKQVTTTIKMTEDLSNENDLSLVTTNRNLVEQTLIESEKITELTSSQVLLGNLEPVSTILTIHVPTPVTRWKKIKLSICKYLSPHIFKVAFTTIANGNDNIAIYVPLFAQSKPWQIIVYVVIFLLMVAVWCCMCYYFIHFPPILKLARKYAEIITPFIFIGLGIYILISSQCFPWLFNVIKTKKWTMT
ncbi:unnamed protein product, partial [Didymodactylos carnosus]